MLGSLPALGRTNMLCTHNPVMGVPICVFLFAIAIVATIWKAFSLMITRQRNLGLPSYAKPFSCFLLGVVNIVFSFYFLLRCVTHNWNWGYEMSLEHELRSSDFGFAGLLWFVSMLLILTAIRMVARSKSWLAIMSGGVFYIFEIYGNSFLEPGSESVFVPAFFLAIAIFIFILLPIRKQSMKSCLLSICGVLLHVPAFYFLFCSASNNLGRGQSPEMCSFYLGIAGVLWGIAMICFLKSIKFFLSHE